MICKVAPMITFYKNATAGPVSGQPRVDLLSMTMVACLALLAGCAAERPLRTPNVSDAVRAALPAAPLKSVAVPTRISDALAEPAPPAVPPAPEPRLDLLVNNALAREVFLAIVADTRYSMLMHPDVAGNLSVTLRGVTVAEALEAIRDVYGYDFKIEGRRITIYAPTLQTRIFTVNYPLSQRIGNSELRVSSGSMPQMGATSTLSSSSNSGSSGISTTVGSMQNEGSRVSTTSKTDFWSELTLAVNGLIGKEPGHSVITSPQAGIMAVRAMPDELRRVEQFLKAAQISIERQVMLEAKIVEIELRDGYQSGVDWSALKNGGGSTGAMGVMSGNADISNVATTSNTLIRGAASNLPGFTAGTLLANGASLPSAGAGLFGLAFATDGFQAVLGFLETQGDVQILSSPRIATLNNQKAILKVGVEDFFVTDVRATTVTTASSTLGTYQVATPSFSPIFAGISLDVTPQIDDANNIMLHVHPSVTTVTEVNKQVTYGGTASSLPMASVSVNETDTLVRIQDGNIVAIGGLMRVSTSRTSSGLPGSSDVPVLSTLFGNRANTGGKKEVVVLIKPTIIRTAQDWEAQTQRTRAALDDMDAVRARVIKLDGSVDSPRADSVVK